MWDFFSAVGENNVLVWLIIGGLSAWAVACVAGHWRKVRLAEYEANLKRHMLDKGMSAAEIEQVLRASKESSAFPQITGAVETDKAALVTLMAEYAYSGADIDRVLREFGHLPEGMPADQRREAIRGRALAVQGMVENEKEAEEIEQVLRAFNSREKQPGESIQVLNRL